MAEKVTGPARPGRGRDGCVAAATVSVAPASPHIRGAALRGSTLVKYKVCPSARVRWCVGSIRSRRTSQAERCRLGGAGSNTNRRAQGISDRFAVNGSLAPVFWTRRECCVMVETLWQWRHLCISLWLRRYSCHPRAARSGTRRSATARGVQRARTMRPYRPASSRYARPEYSLRRCSGIDRAANLQLLVHMRKKLLLVALLAHPCSGVPLAVEGAANQQRQFRAQMCRHVERQPIAQSAQYRAQDVPSQNGGRVRAAP